MEYIGFMVIALFIGRVIWECGHSVGVESGKGIGRLQERRESLEVMLACEADITLDHAPVKRHTDMFALDERRN